jgi:hypothetical protein
MVTLLPNWSVIVIGNAAAAGMTAGEVAEERTVVVEVDEVIAGTAGTGDTEDCTGDDPVVAATGAVQAEKTLNPRARTRPNIIIFNLLIIFFLSLRLFFDEVLLAFAEPAATFYQPGRH